MAEDSFVDFDITSEIHNSLTKHRNIELNSITPVTPGIIENQATINIGTIGHVAHGKTTLTKAITGINTIKFKSEKERNITIKLGYANAKIYQCPTCPKPYCYQSFGSFTGNNPRCENKDCDSLMKLVRHVSFVDCPGHEILMSQMLNGATVMDSALLLVASNEPCPQPQTAEHLEAVNISKLDNIVVLQNKIDLVNKNLCLEQYENIKRFINNTRAKDSPIIPISAQKKYNINFLLEYIVNSIPLPIRDYTSTPQLTIIRSFDVNKPGTEVKNIVGGIIGGTITRGILKLGDRIEIRPGIITQDINGNITCKPIITKVVSLFAEKNNLDFAIPGGLIGVGTKIDGTLTRSDRLVGHVLGIPNHMPDIFHQLELNYFLLQRLLGVKTTNNQYVQVDSLEKNEALMVNIGSLTISGTITAIKEDLCKIKLSQPACASINDKVSLSRCVDKHWRLIGWGVIIRGNKININGDN